MPDPQRVLVGVDGSEPSAAAVEWAAGYAEPLGAVVQLVTVWRWPTSYGAPISVPIDFNPESDAERVLDRAAAAVREAHPKLTVETSLMEGRAAATLIELSESADLVVVGSRGLGAFAGMVLGSVSSHVVTHAHCSVVVVRDKQAD